MHHAAIPRSIPPQDRHIESMFKRQKPRGECIGRVLRRHRNPCLTQYGPIIEGGGDFMDRTTMHIIARIQCALMSVQPFVFW